MNDPSRPFPWTSCAKLKDTDRKSSFTFSVLYLRYGEIRTATFTVVVVLKNSTDNRSSLQVGGPYGGEQRQIEAGNVEDNLSSGERNSAEESSANESAEQNKAQLSFINEANIFIVPSLSEEGEKDNGQREEGRLVVVAETLSMQNQRLSSSFFNFRKR